MNPPTDGAPEPAEAGDDAGNDAGDELARLTAEAATAATERPDDRAAAARALAALVPALARSARRAGARAVGAGRWATDLVLEIAPHIPIRDAATLRAHHPGRTDRQIADALVSHAATATAALGAAAGGLAAVEFAAPPTLLAAPVQLTAHLLAVTAVELKLVAELHELAGQRAAGSTVDRGRAYLVSWMQQRALSSVVDDRGALAVGPMLGEALRRQLRAHLLRRLTRSTTTLAPLLIGAVAGAEVDRRTTKALGRRLRRGLEV